MRTKLISMLIVSLFMCVFAITAIPTVIAEDTTPDYGKYPNNYKELVKSWVNVTFFSPSDVRILEISEPEKLRLRFSSSIAVREIYGEYVYGYRIKVTFVAKNHIGNRTINLFIEGKCGAITKQWEGWKVPYYL